MRFFGPKHCTTCGDQFVNVTYVDGYRESDGAPIFKSWSKCPRNSDRRPDFMDRYQLGSCYPLAPFACAVERAAYADHRPHWGACKHYAVSNEGDACWTKDGTQITADHRLIEAVA